MPQAIDPNAIATAYVNGMNAAGPAYSKGIDAVTQNPAEAAIAQLPKAARNYAASIANGKTERGLRRSTLGGWKQQCKNVGAARLGTGATAAKNKVVAYYNAVGGAIDALRATIAQMPNDTMADSKARANAWMDGMAAIAAGRQ